MLRRRARYNCNYVFDLRGDYISRGKQLVIGESAEVFMVSNVDIVLSVQEEVDSLSGGACPRDTDAEGCASH